MKKAIFCAFMPVEDASVTVSIKRGLPDIALSFSHGGLIIRLDDLSFGQSAFAMNPL
jgi:hypothetical protein